MHALDPDPLDLTETDVVIAAIVEAGGLGVGVAGHTLGDFDSTSVGEVIGDPGSLACSRVSQFPSRVPCCGILGMSVI